jgi:hypothetical protein
MVWDPEIAISKTYNTNSQLADAISQANPTMPFCILASKPPLNEILSHKHLLRYYYINASLGGHDQIDVNVHDRVTRIDSIHHFASELYGDLGQYYRDKAQEALFEHQDRMEAKCLLTKSKKCFEILKLDIQKTLQHYKDLSVL